MSAISFYDNLTRHIVPGPRSIPYFGTFILLPLSLLIPRSLLSKWQNIVIFLPLITLCTLQAWRDMNGVDVISVNGLLWSFFMIGLHDPRRDFRLVRWVEEPLESDQSKQSSQNGAASEKSKNKPASITASSVTRHVVEQKYPANIPDRMSWIMKLLASNRLENWRIGHPSHDRQQPGTAAFESRRQFLAYATLSFLSGVIVLDLTRSYIELDPYFTNLNVPISSPLPFDAGRYLAPRFVRSMVIGAQAWALISQMFYLPAMLPVILNGLGCIPDNASPHNWPAYFGSPTAILRYGVRGLWGTFWHQTMRWSTTGPGYALADSLGLSRKSLLRYAIISTSAFGLSGVVHAGLVPPEPRYASTDANHIRLYFAGFFSLQAVAVTIEALVARVMIALTGADRWNRGGGLTIRTMVNVVWIVVWFSISLPVVGEGCRQLGYWTVWPLPISIIRGLNGDGWLTWEGS